jgi:hypothetical protein
MPWLEPFHWNQTFGQCHHDCPWLVSASGEKKRVHGKVLYCFYKTPPCCRINNGFETREIHSCT